MPGLADGAYLSIYTVVDPLAEACDIFMRHDQNMALWRKTGRRIELLRYWEFERLSGVKHHGLSFASADAALAFIATELAPFGLRPGDLRAIWGTPGLEAGPALQLPDALGALPYHSVAHLYSGLLSDTAAFRAGPVLGLAVDGAPDLLFGAGARAGPYYAGAFCDSGRTTYFPVSSPATLWAFLRDHYGMAEGSLMALAEASHARLAAPPAEPCPADIRTAKEAAQAGRWLRRQVAAIDAADPAAERGPCAGHDARFSARENRISMAAKLVQEVSDAMMARTVEAARARFGFDPGATLLSLSGGFALNCPATSRLMNRFGFRGMLQSPAVNDGGLSLGIGLHQFFVDEPQIAFRLDHGYHGRLPGTAGPVLAPHVIASGPAVPDELVRDIMAGPVARVAGPAEIGPRALGNRSLLADPRSDAARDRLNAIKGRQWWRPVAPVVLEEAAGEIFEQIDASPYMLRTYRLRPEMAARVPAIRHLDGTARVQTVSRAQNPELHALLAAFGEATGLPLLCNTSLNDNGEPIVDSLDEALAFALRKGVDVVWCDGRRLVLRPGAAGLPEGPLPRPGRHAFLRPAAERRQAAEAALRAAGLSRDDLILLSSIAPISAADMAEPGRAARLQRRVRLLRAAFGDQETLDFVRAWHDDHVAARNRACPEAEPAGGLEAAQ